MNVWLLRRKNASFAVGHMALAYLLGKGSAKPLKVNLNIPLILVLSIIPDMDLIFMRDLHRGPTHSIITALIVFIPVFLIYRRKAVPYFLALASHSLIADFFIGGRIQLLWPLTSQQFGLHEMGGPYLSIWSPVNVILEWVLFGISTVIMLKNGDLFTFFKSRKSNLLLAIPIITVLLPTFWSIPLEVPILLVPPHLFYLVLFSISVLIVLVEFFQKKRRNS
jgi:membrane-bound metal-dependent hydrolase YbcI (DUF457 family)